MERLLIVDDDLGLCELVAEYLSSEGFAVEAVHDGEQGIERALVGDYALVILDVMLPGVGGLEVLRRVRARSRLPVLMLTARGDDVDRIIGLEVGADDYLPKPFNPRELVARIRAILRRTQPDDATERSPEPLTVGDVELDAGARVVHRAGQMIELTAVEFDLLALLLSQEGRVVKREDLVKSVLGRNLTPFDRSLDMHISHLRRKLGPHTGGADRVKTVRGVGYIYTKG